MDLDINESFEIVGSDGSELKRLRAEENTLDMGAQRVLEALEEFCDVQMEKYEGSIPYDKLFCALRQIISSAVEKESIRNNLITGLISEKKNGMNKVRVEQNFVTPKAQPKPVLKGRVAINKSAITNFAKSHTLREVYEHFDFTKYEDAKNYVYYHKITFVKTKTGAKPDVEFEKKVKLLSKSMTLCEMARTLGKTQQALGMYCLRHNINYVGRGSK